MKDELEQRATDYISSVLDFNGERIDPVLGGYHLGNGYRLYSPSLRRFTSPDSMSPFGKGGINQYAYCEGDPINNTDPTGHHVRLGAIFSDIVEGMDAAFDVAAAVATGGESLAVIQAIHALSGVIGIGTEIAGQSISGHPTTRKLLDGISFGSGVTNTATGLMSEGVNIHKNGLKRPRTVRGFIKSGAKVVYYSSAVASEGMEVVTDVLAKDPSRHKLDTTLEKISTGLGFISSAIGFFDAAPDFIDNIKESRTRVSQWFDGSTNHKRRATKLSPRAPQPTSPAHHADLEDNDLFGHFFGALEHRFS